MPREIDRARIEALRRAAEAVVQECEIILLCGDGSEETERERTEDERRARMRPIKDAARKYGKSEKTVLKWAQEAEAFERDGHRNYYDPEKLRAWREEQTRKTIAKQQTRNERALRT